MVCFDLFGHFSAYQRVILRNRGYPFILKRVTDRVLALLSFFTGFFVLALETVAFRELAIVFGSSIHVTGALLLVVMISMSLGYAKGARSEISSMIGILVAGIWVFIFGLFLKSAVLEYSFEIRKSLMEAPQLKALFPPLLAATLLYGIPTFLMSRVTPYLLVSSRKKQGLLLCMGTLGSIAGILLPVFLTIPTWGLRASVAMAGLSAFLIYWTWVRRWSFKSGPIKLLLGFGVGVGLTGALLRTEIGMGSAYLEDHPGMEWILVEDGVYEQIRIAQSVKDPRRIAYFPSRVYRHTMIFPDSVWSDLLAIQYLAPALLKSINGKDQRVLSLGTGLGMVPLTAERLNEVTVSKLWMDTVDLEPKLEPTIRSLFPIQKFEFTKFFSGDARVFVKDTDPSTYDHAVIDLYQGEAHPFHVVTVEFFQALKSKLTSQGTVFINTNGRPENVMRFGATLRVAGFKSVFLQAFDGRDYLVAFVEEVRREQLLKDWTELTSRASLDPRLLFSVGASLINLEPLTFSKEDLAFYQMRDNVPPDFALQTAHEGKFESHLRDASVDESYQKVLAGVTRVIQEARRSELKIPDAKTGIKAITLLARNQKSF